MNLYLSDKLILNVNEYKFQVIYLIYLCRFGIQSHIIALEQKCPFSEKKGKILKLEKLSYFHSMFVYTLCGKV